MKFSLSWLTEYLETDKDLDEILHWLTMVGLEVEGVEDRGKLLKEFVIFNFLSFICLFVTIHSLTLHLALMQIPINYVTDVTPFITK